MSDTSEWVSVSHKPCPSCAALNGQVHTQDQWDTFGVAPKDPALYCGAACSCHKEETESPEMGDLSAVPLRAGYAAGTAAPQEQANAAANQQDQEQKTMTNPRNTELRLDTFQTTPRKTAQGYETLVIHAGSANGWNFTEDVLKQSVKFFEGIECFTDHNMYGESVHDLAGVFSNPRWDDSQKGIVTDLRPVGPSADLLRAYADEMLSGATPHPNMGFSPVLIFTSDDKDVMNILRVRSVDMVINPAFRTKFIAEKFQQRRIEMPNDETKTPDETIQAMKEITGAQAEITASVKGAQETHLAMCSNLLETALDVASVDLPDSAVSLIRADFAGKTFKPAELKARIDAFKDAFAQQTAAASIVGPAQITGMFTREDQLQAAIDDLLGAPREKAAENLKVHKFSGIKEAYLMLTNDFNFTGDIDARLAKFQGTTATFPNLVANALNKAIVMNWNKLGQAGYNWWEKIATVEPFETLNTITWLRLGTIASLPTVAEGAEYTELGLGDNGESSTFIKYGGYLSFTLEAMDRDDTRKLRAAPREIANAALRNISEQIAAIFTTASGAGPTLTDTGALFNATAVTTKGGHANLLTTALGTDYTAWNAVASAMYNQPMLVANGAGENVLTYGKKQALEPSIFLGPRALKSQAESLFMPRWESKVQSIASNGGVTYGGFVEPITVPEWTDATDWAAVIDPNILPGVMIGTRYGLIPQIIIAGNQNDPAMFMNDESRLKVRHFLATGIGNWSALHKSNVGG